MNKTNLYKIKRKTIYKVVVFHALFIAILSLKFSSFHHKKKKDLVVNNIIMIPKKEIKIESKPSILKTPAKKSIKKTPLKNVAKSQAKKVTPSTRNYDNLFSKLENQLKNLDHSSQTMRISKELSVPKTIKSLDIDKKINTIENNNTNQFKELLIKELQANLQLPEFGEVKVEFTIHPNGQITNVTIIDYKSQKNQNYLKNSLSELSFKSINKMFDEPQKFVVIFKNE